MNTARLADLYARLAANAREQAELYEALATEAGGDESQRPAKKPPRVPALQVCNDVEVSEVDAAAARKALARYRR